MHELSIAINIVEIAEEEVRKTTAEKVSELTLEIGDLSGVIIEALNFAMEEAVKGSVLENARIKINKIEAVARCSDCGHEFTTKEHLTVCPKCSSSFSDIIKGKELNVKSLVIE